MNLPRVASILKEVPLSGESLTKRDNYPAIVRQRLLLSKEIEISSRIWKDTRYLLTFRPLWTFTTLVVVISRRG